MSEPAVPSPALHLAVVDLQCRWAAALDARDWDGVRACFTRDIRSELPRTGVSEGVEELLARQRPVLERLDLTHHLLSNHRVQEVGGGLVATCAVVARHLRQGEAYTFGGRYTDEVVDVGGALRIARRRLEVLWSEGDPAVLV